MPSGRFAARPTTRGERLRQEFEKTLSKIEKRQSAGRAGGEAKALKNKDAPLAKTTNLPEAKREPAQIALFKVPVLPG